MTPPTSREGLLACPFCGNANVELHRSEHAGMSWVACIECGLESPSETGVTDEQAKAYWNKRGSVTQTPCSGVDPIELRSNVIKVCADISESVATRHRYSNGCDTFQSRAIDEVTKAILGLEDALAISPPNPREAKP